MFGLTFKEIARNTLAKREIIEYDIVTLADLLLQDSETDLCCIENCVIFNNYVTDYKAINIIGLSMDNDFCKDQVKVTLFLHKIRAKIALQTLCLSRFMTQMYNHKSGKDVSFGLPISGITMGPLSYNKFFLENLQIYIFVLFSELRASCEPLVQDKTYHRNIWVHS